MKTIAFHLSKLQCESPTLGSTYFKLPFREPYSLVTKTTLFSLRTNLEIIMLAASPVMVIALLNHDQDSVVLRTAKPCCKYKIVGVTRCSVNKGIFGTIFHSTTLPQYCTIVCNMQAYIFVNVSIPMDREIRSSKCIPG